MSLDAIKARAGSIAPMRWTALPKAVQRILEEDLPRLINVTQAARKYRKSPPGEDAAQAMSELFTSLDALEEPWPPQG